MMKWTKEQFEQLYELYNNGKSAATIAETLNISVPSVKSALYRRKNSSPIRARTSYVKWDESLEESIRTMLANSNYLSEIAEKLNITYASLTSKMRRMDLTFTQHNVPFGNTPKQLTKLFVITESQLRQALNNRILGCTTRGKQLYISDAALHDWLTLGYAFIYIPRNKSGEYVDLWKKAYEEALRRVVTTNEIADTFNKSKMSITYYGKRRNFPLVCSYVCSYNLYMREDVNRWAMNNNLPTLTPTMSDKYVNLFFRSTYINDGWTFYKELQNEV
jgi:DNA-binding CsgD family transcriptional regulator